MNNYNWDELYNELGMGLIIGAVVVLVIVLLTLIGYAKVYEKAGHPGWSVFVPIYGTMVLVKIIGKPSWWVIPISVFYWITNFWDSSLSSVLSIANLVFSIWATNLLVHKFGKGTGFTVGMIFLPFIFAPMLGFGDDQYIGDESVDVDSFGTKTPDVNTES